MRTETNRLHRRGVAVAEEPKSDKPSKPKVDDKGKPKGGGDTADMVKPDPRKDIKSRTADFGNEPPKKV